MVAKLDNHNTSYLMEYLPSEQGGCIWFPEQDAEPDFITSKRSWLGSVSGNSGS
jgi:hypothetical protein